jgi:hypothetical protein
MCVCVCVSDGGERAHCVRVAVSLSVCLSSHSLFACCALLGCGGIHRECTKQERCCEEEHCAVGVAGRHSCHHRYVGGAFSHYVLGGAFSHYVLAFVRLATFCLCIVFSVCLAPIELGLGLSVLPAFVRGVCVAHIQCTGHSCMHVTVSSLGYKGLSENSWPKATARIMEVGWYSASPCVLSFGRAYDTLFCFVFSS